MVLGSAIVVPQRCGNHKAVDRKKISFCGWVGRYALFAVDRWTYFREDTEDRHHRAGGDELDGRNAESRR